MPAILLTGTALFIASGFPFWPGENGTEAATSVARLGALVAAPASDLSVRPDPVTEEKIVIAAADILAGSQPVLEDWRSTSMAEPESVTAPMPAGPLPVLPMKVAALTEPEAAVRPETTTMLPPIPPRPLTKARVEETFSRVLLGKWVPNRDVCTDPEASEFLPLQISRTQAIAGDGECTFTSKTKVGSTWNVVAQCTDGSATWTSNVSIEVAKSHLTWTSERGRQSYERCDEAPQRVASRHKALKTARAAPKPAAKRVVARRIPPTRPRA